MNRIIAAAVVSSLVVTGCAHPRSRTAAGAGTGAVVGAATGALVSGRGGKGAIIGATAGALIGGAIGNSLDRQAYELAKVAETQRTEDGIITTLRNSILFDTNSTSLKAGSLDAVNRLADIIRKHPEDRILVIGHTDDRGAAQYNEKLSFQRAQAVKAQMAGRGVPVASVDVLGQGEAQPVAPNDSPENMSKNRRVELHITVDETKMK